MDKLQTDHQGTYVLKDLNFRWTARYSEGLSFFSFFFIMADCLISRYIWWMFDRGGGRCVCALFRRCLPRNQQHPCRTRWLFCVCPIFLLPRPHERQLGLSDTSTAASVRPRAGSPGKPGLSCGRSSRVFGWAGVILHFAKCGLYHKDPSAGSLECSFM